MTTLTDRTTGAPNTSTQAVDDLSEEGMVPLGRWEDIPPFANEDEEAEFWATHFLSENLAKDLKPRTPNDPDLPKPRPMPRTMMISLRLDETTLRRIKALAAKRRQGYQSLLKQFLAERLYEEEKREGLLV